MEVVYWFHVLSSIGDVAFFNATSPQKQSTCMVTGLQHQIPQKTVALVILLCISSGIGNVTFFDAAPLQNNQHVGLLAFNAMSPPKNYQPTALVK